MSGDCRRLGCRAGAFALLVVMGAVPGIVRGWQWPFERFEILRNFGSYSDGYALPGVELSGDGEAVLIETGELVFRHVRDDRLRGAPAPLGSFAAVEHPHGFRSLYAHLEPDATAALPRELDRGAALGPVGVSGYTAGDYLHFQILDRELEGRVNPAVLLPPYGGVGGPVLQEVGLLVDGTVVSIDAALDLAPGVYPLVVSVWDRAPAGPVTRRLVPYRFVLEREGEELFRVSFDLERVRNGRQWFNGVSFEELMLEPFVYSVAAIELATEPVSYRLVVENSLGDAAVRSFTLRAAPDPADDTIVNGAVP